MNTISITPFQAALANPLVTLPGSKSITNRALLLSMLSQKEVLLKGALFSRDTKIMIAAMQELGIPVHADQENLTISVPAANRDNLKEKASIHIGNAGTAARFLTAFLGTLSSGEYKMDGDEAVRKRPMKGLLDALESMGCQVEYHGEKGFFPFTLRPQGIKTNSVQVDAKASSQLLSALLFVLPFCPSSFSLELVGETVSKPFVTMTCQMMKDFGASFTQEGNTYTNQGVGYPSAPSEYLIEPDATAASYFMCLPLVVGGSVTLKDMGTIRLQGDVEFIEVVSQFGLTITPQGNNLFVERTATEPNFSSENPSFDFNAFSDTFLGLAAIAPLFNKAFTIAGIAHTRHQETDRIAAMATELKKVGQHIEETEDTLHIQPQEIQATTIDTYEDHRVAMSFGVLGCTDLRKDGSAWLSINDPECCGKTFPNFFELLEELRLHSLQSIVS